MGTISSFRPCVRAWIFHIFSLNKLFDKQSSCRWFDTPWRSSLKWCILAPVILRFRQTKPMGILTKVFCISDQNLVSLTSTGDGLCGTDKLRIDKRIRTHARTHKLCADYDNIKKSVMRNFDAFFYVSLNKLLDKQSSCWWFETQ